MKKYLLAVFAALFLHTMQSKAQDVQQVAGLKIATYSLQKVLTTMPQYAEAQNTLEQLKQKYDQEMQRSSKDFNVKYEEFLEQQKNFTTAIRNKRQAELEAQIQKNLEFKKQAQGLLEQAKEDVMLPMRKRVQDVIAQILTQKQMVMAINIDEDKGTVVNPALAQDITEEVIAIVNKQ